MQIDAIDQQLIAALRENARAPAAELARRLKLSRTTVQSRLERLERGGIVTGYTVRVSEAHELGQIHAIVLMTVAPKQAGVVVAAARAMPQVRRLHSVSGPFDLIVELATPTAAEMDAIIDALGAMDGVERTTSSIVLSTKIDR